MHELSLAVAIVELVERHAGGRPVEAVNVRVGAMRQVVPRSLSFQFEFAARGSVCEGATLVQEPIAALLRLRGLRERMGSGARWRGYDRGAGGFVSVPRVWFVAVLGRPR